MNKIILLSIMLLVCILIISILLVQAYHHKKQLKYIGSILKEIEDGNLDRRFLAMEHQVTADICYKMNEIVLSCKHKLNEAFKSQKASQQLLTNLSHDVKTPLTSLIGYLDAIKSNVVQDDEKEHYLDIAHDKAYELKNYIDMLFEWVKLSSHERSYHFESTDINEFTRTILVGLIPLLEANQFVYELDISEEELFLDLDSSGYTRIVHNLINNVMEHSDGNYLMIKIVKANGSVIITVTDNGKGIPAMELPYIFERLYKIDSSRSTKGSGLGLYIVKELVLAHGGSISVNSIPYEKTDFIVTLPFSSSIS